MQKRRDENAVLILEEEILVPVIQNEVFLSSWEMLYDWGRNMSAEEYRGLQEKDDQLEMDEEGRLALTIFMFEVRKVKT